MVHCSVCAELYVATPSMLTGLWFRGFVVVEISLTVFGAGFVTVPEADLLIPYAEAVIVNAVEELTFIQR